MCIAFVSSNYLIFILQFHKHLHAGGSSGTTTSYPLPQGLLLNEPLVSDGPDRSDQLITTHGSKTWLGVAVQQAWQNITPVDQELMLFCWAARQED
jgi:hypothetical protein